MKLSLNIRDGIDACAYFCYYVCIKTKYPLWFLMKDSEFANILAWLFLIILLEVTITYTIGEPQAIIKYRIGV